MPIALITGANRGLGRATAQSLSAQGFHVIVAAREVAAARQVADAISRTLTADGTAASASAAQLDVTDPESVRVLAGQVADEFGVLDVLVNNAGILPEATRPTTEIVDVELFRHTYEVNVLGAVAMLQEFLPLLRKSAAARVVNVSSTMGSLTDQTDPDSPYRAVVVPAYQSSKAALNNVTISAAKLLADTHIKVTSVCPGFVQTELAPANLEQAPLTAGQAAEVVVRAATLPDDASSGTFIDAAGPVPW